MEMKIMGNMYVCVFGRPEKPQQAQQHQEWTQASRISLSQIYLTL